MIFPYTCIWANFSCITSNSPDRKTDFDVIHFNTVSNVTYKPQLAQIHFISSYICSSNLKK